VFYPTKIGENLSCSGGGVAMPVVYFKRVPFVLALLALVGCSQYKPFVRPDPLPSLQERENIYSAHKIRLDPVLMMAHIGDKGGPLGIGQMGMVCQYMASSGDPESARKLRSARVYGWTGLVASLAEVVSGIEYFNYHRTNGGLVIAANIEFLSPLLENVFFEWGKRDCVRPAVDTFNRYLRESLQLPVDSQVGPTTGKP
jgi:hypothetical protein